MPRMSLSPLDWFTTGYCISLSDTSSFSLMCIYFIPECLRMLATGLHYSHIIKHTSEGTGSLKGLGLWSNINDDTSQCLDILPSLYPYTQSMTSLALLGVLSSDDTGVHVLQQLPHLCPQLVNLSFPSINSPENMLLVFQTLPQLRSLEKLLLPQMDHDTNVCQQLLVCPSLKQLEIKGEWYVSDCIYHIQVLTLS